MAKNSHQPEAQLKEHHLNFIEYQNTCVLCGSQLDIRVEAYLENYCIREEAHCPKCKLKARVKEHIMQ